MPTSYLDACFASICPSQLAESYWHTLLCPQVFQSLLIARQKYIYAHFISLWEEITLLKNPIMQSSFTWCPPNVLAIIPIIPNQHGQSSYCLGSFQLTIQLIQRARRPRKMVVSEGFLQQNLGFYYISRIQRSLLFSILG